MKVNMWKKICGVVMSVVYVLGLGLAAPVLAADYSGVLSTTVTVDSLDKLAQVTTSLSITNKTTAATPKQIAMPIYGTGIKAMKATYQGTSTSIIGTVDETTGTIVLETTKSYKGKGSKWGINLTYSSNIVQAIGETQAVIFGENNTTSASLNITKETRRLIVKLGFGVATKIGASVPTSTLSSGKQVLTWSANKALNYATGVVYGSSASADVVIATTLKNSGFWWKSVELILPPDNNQQKVWLKEISPLPTATRIDIDGNVIASYRLRPKQSTDVSATLQVQVNNYTYALLQATETLSVSEAEALNHYLADAASWGSLDLSANESTKQLDILDAAMVAARALDSTTLGSEAREQSFNRTNKLIGALRASGVPARRVDGIFNLKGINQARYWAEVYIGGMGWITVDPIADSHSYQTADARYLALIITSSVGSSRSLPIEDTTVTYLDEPQEMANELPEKLSSTTYMFLPILGFRVSKLELGYGSVVDGATLLFEGERTTPLGSLAPLQSIASRDPLIGSKALKNTKVSYGLTSAGSFDSIYTGGTVKVSWLPFWILNGLLLIAAAVLFFWKRLAPIRQKFIRRSHKQVEAEQLASEDKPIKAKKSYFGGFKKFKLGRSKTPEISPIAAPPAPTTVAPTPPKTYRRPPYLGPKGPRKNSRTLIQ